MVNAKVNMMNASISSVLQMFTNYKNLAGKSKNPSGDGTEGGKCIVCFEAAR